MDELTEVSFEVAKAKETVIHLAHKLERLYDKYSEELRKIAH
jgi:hypothetical protein